MRHNPLPGEKGSPAAELIHVTSMRRGSGSLPSSPSAPGVYSVFSGDLGSAECAAPAKQSGLLLCKQPLPFPATREGAGLGDAEASAVLGKGGQLQGKASLSHGSGQEAAGAHPGWDRGKEKRRGGRCHPRGRCRLPPACCRRVHGNDRCLHSCSKHPRSALRLASPACGMGEMGRTKQTATAVAVCSASAAWSGLWGEKQQPLNIRAKQHYGRQIINCYKMIVNYFHCTLYSVNESPLLVSWSHYRGGEQCSAAAP